MKTVHILATVRKPELLPAALLVFRTLRTGFPTAKVCVWGNSLDSAGFASVATDCAKVNAHFQNLAPTSHDAWIESLIEESTEPFWICDTDIVFWTTVEKWFETNGEVTYAGRYEPEFHEEWTKTRHMERLHTCLMWINPGAVRAALRAWMAKIPPPWGRSADFPFIRQHFVPLRNELPLFYDTCAGLYHAHQGTPFSIEQDAAFDHLHCSTYLDLIGNNLSANNFVEAHQWVYQNHQVARGAKTQQDVYYAKQQLPPLAVRNKGRK
jgi:hypothetical protein